MENDTNNTEAPEGLSQNEPKNIESSWGVMQIAPDSPELAQEWSGNWVVVLQSINQESQSQSEWEQINIEIISIETEWRAPWEENPVSIVGDAWISLRLKLGLKIFLWMIWVSVLWVTIFYGLDFYEKKNHCRIIFGHTEWSISPITCKPISIPRRSCESWNPLSPFYVWCSEPMKPLILLYPETKQEVSVELEYTPGFSATFPLYDNAKKGWSVTASPDGTLLDHTTQQETYWLFWEGNLTHANYNTSKGWVIKGWEVREFLYEKLTEIGLNTKEKSDFIMFWYPKLQEYPYIQITFAGEDYNQSAPLKITPKPDSLLRVFMVAKPLDTSIVIEPQKLEKFERKGFSVVEWGGTVLE